MRPVGQRKAADVRTLENNIYYLPREYVDRFANEVRGRKMKGPAVPARGVTTVPPDAESESESEADGDDGEAVEGDPTDGAAASDVISEAKKQAIEACVRNWKAAASDDKKKSMWEIFDETGIFAAVCRHGMILIILDMVRSGEL